MPAVEGKTVSPKYKTESLRASERALGVLAVVFCEEVFQSLGLIIKSDWASQKGQHRSQCEGLPYDHLTTMALVKHVTFPEAHFITYGMGPTVQQLHCHDYGGTR